MTNERIIRLAFMGRRNEIALIGYYYDGRGRLFGYEHGLVLRDTIRLIRKVLRLNTQ